MNTVNPAGRLIGFVPRQQTQMSAETPELVAASQDVLLQGLQLLFDLGDPTYSRVLESPYNASIGQHYRHVMEHFQCLLRGVRSGEVNYDARDRNLRLESEVTFASIATCDILRGIKNYNSDMLTRSCKVIHSVSYETSQPTAIESNVGRELAYCTGHAIHHYAIIRLVCSQVGVNVPKEFGFAPSTLKHMSTLNAD